MDCGHCGGRMIAAHGEYAVDLTCINCGRAHVTEAELADSLERSAADVEARQSRRRNPHFAGWRI